jgi:hypothetical protein
VDALRVLRHIAGFGNAYSPGCVHIGEMISGPMPA